MKAAVTIAPRGTTARMPDEACHPATRAMEPFTGPPCPRCRKPAPLCLCGGIEPIDNRVSVVILQHPQEQDRLLGTAALTRLCLGDAAIKTGLSWPSLAKVLGRPADPRRWAVLYLGSAKPARLANDRDVVVVSRTGELDPDQDLSSIEGVVVLDGSWSQAKTLWWRNPWMLKCRRVVLRPRQPSRYGSLRREPRREGLSTIEATAMLVSLIEGRPQIGAALAAVFERLLERYRDSNAGETAGASARGPAPKRGRPCDGK